jgi:hypothetical protein
VHLETSTKPHVHQKFEIFWTNIASTMGCPNSKNRPKQGLRPLGVNLEVMYKRPSKKGIPSNFREFHSEEVQCKNSPQKNFDV